MKKWHLNTRCYDTVAVKVGSIICICLVAFTSLTFTTGCRETASDNRTDCQKAGLRGQIKICERYDILFGEDFGRYTMWSDQLDWQIIESLKFLISGNRSEATYYWGLGIPIYKEGFTYDNDGKMTECTIHAYDIESENYSPKYSYTTFYDDDTGRIDKIEGYEYKGDKKDDLFSWIHIYEYPEDNKVIISSYDWWGELNWRHIQKYNASGMRVESAHYRYDESYVIQWSEKFKYNSKGNRIEWARYDSSGSLEWRNIYRYDGNGNEVECIEYDSTNKLIHKYFYRYISEEVLEKSYVELHRFEEVIQSGLNPEEIIDTDNWFDMQGNWRVKITLEEINGLEDTYLEITNIEKRVIKYY